MNNYFSGRVTGVLKRQWKKLAISVVIFFEVIAIFIVASYSWVETVSSIKITNATNTIGTVDTYVFTEAMIGKGHGNIDLGKYFKQAGDMHFAPASSADGTTMFFPKANISSGFIYRKGNVSDKNTSYLSVTFKLRADTNADFFFEQVPTFSALGEDIRISVTSQSEGNTEAPTTSIYALTANADPVVNATNGSTGATEVKAISNHIKGKNKTRLFAVGGNETKIVTINVWLQKKVNNVNTDLTQNMSQAITITNFGITSDLTPRRVTLIPTPTWDISSATNQTFYAWCWNSPKGDASKLYKLALDENEHYSFEYNGTYQKTLFFRSGNANLTTEIMNANNNEAWSNGTIWNKTEDTSIPNDPIDPTYIIQTMNGSNEIDNSSGNNSTVKKSTGDWVDPATIMLSFVNDQNTDWGSLTATTYIGETTSSHVMETTNTDSNSKHFNTIHAWPGKKLTVTAASKTHYAFIGWYNNPEGLDNGGDKRCLSNSATYTTDAPSSSSEIVYYAKFKEICTLTIHKYVDGSNSNIDAGTITIGNSTIGEVTSSTNSLNISKTYDKGTSVPFSAAPEIGYEFEGFYTVAADSNTEASNPVTLNADTNYYARFKTKSYDVITHACYSTDGGTSYTDDDSTGGTVQSGDAAAGATSTKSVKYKSSVTLTATPESGYEFVGWYTAATGGSVIAEGASNATYSYKLNTADDVDVYARFIKKSTTIIYVAPRENWGDNYYVRLYDSDSNNISSNTNGFVQAEYDSDTGYYKATFSTIKTGSFRAILAKDSSYTGQVPASGNEGYQGNSLGSNYLFKDGTDGLESYSNKRCIWFIITENWLRDYLKNDRDFMQVYVNSSNTKMRRVNDNAYVVELSNPSGTVYFRDCLENGSIRENGNNQWVTTIQLDKSQYTQDSYNTGQWTN